MPNCLTVLLRSRTILSSVPYLTCPPEETSRMRQQTRTEQNSHCVWSTSCASGRVHVKGAPLFTFFSIKETVRGGKDRLLGSERMEAGQSDAANQCELSVWFHSAIAQPSRIMYALL